MDQQKSNSYFPRTDGYAHIKLSYVLAVYLNQQDTSTLTSLLERYAGYSADVLEQVQFVVIDDCSPTPITLPDDLDLNVRLFRINENISWNQPGARNLGVVAARSDKVLLTDLDHLIPEQTLRTVLRMRAPGRTMYKMRRVDTDGKEKKSHPNTFVLSRSRFLRLYGYDEVYCGHYGFDDAMFWRWQRYHGTRFLYLPRNCYAQLRTIDTETSYHSLERDLTHNRAIAERNKQAWKVHGSEVGHSRLFLNFSWKEVEDRHYSVRRSKPGLHRWWAKTWWWRWLVGGTR